MGSRFYLATRDTHIHPSLYPHPHYTTLSLSLHLTNTSSLLSSVVVAVAVVATHFIHFKCYDERRGGSGTCSPPPSARRSIVLATMKHSERRKQ